jgi:hypothetical protein
VSVLDIKARKTAEDYSRLGQHAAHCDFERRSLGVYRRPDRAADGRDRYGDRHTVKTWVKLDGLGYGGAPTQRRALAADGDSRSRMQVDVIDLKTMTLARKVEVGKSPQEVLVRPDGKAAYVSCTASHNVAEIDLATWNVSRMIATGKGTDGLGWAK